MGVFGHSPGRLLVDYFGRGREVTVNHGVQKCPDRLDHRRDRHAGDQAATALQNALRLAQCTSEVGRELQPVPANGGVECRVIERERFDVHDLEPCVGDAQRSSVLDHPRREIDADDLAARSDELGDWPAQDARTAREIQDPHPRSGPRELDHPCPAARFAAGHDLVQAPLVSLGVTAEHARKEILRFHEASRCHSRSSQPAAEIASPLVRLTTWIPTGRPSTGAGMTTTGWPVVLKGRVNRVSGSRASLPASTDGATIAVAGTSRASIPSIAFIASFRNRGHATSASSKSTARIWSPRCRWPRTSAPYLSG